MYMKYDGDPLVVALYFVGDVVSQSNAILDGRFPTHVLLDTMAVVYSHHECKKKWMRVSPSTLRQSSCAIVKCIVLRLEKTRRPF